MIGEIIGAGASLLGGLFNRNSQEKANAANLAFAREQLDRNEALQREFAQSGVRWKVDDAKAAGVHPLFALGAQTHSFSPVSVGGGQEASSSAGDAIAQAGQNIGRAVQAGMTRDERDASSALTALQLEKAGLENEMLRTQITRLRNPPGQPPAMPTLTPPGALSIKSDDLKQTPDTVPETRQTRALGIPLLTNPWFGDAESGENRYGEIGEQISGAVNYPADVAYTLYQRWPEIQRFLSRRWNINKAYIQGRR